MHNRAVKTLFWAYLVLLLIQFCAVCQAPEYDNAILSTVDDYVDQSHPVRMGTRRANFFAFNISYVIYPELGSHWYYSSCNDTETWATPTYYTRVSVGDIAFRYDEARNILHVVRGGFGGENGIYYQQGTPDENGTISFNAKETISTGQWHDYPVVNFDSNGYVYMASRNNSRVWASKNSDNTTGGWTNAVGFPVSVNSTGSWSPMIQIAMLANDNVQFLYYHAQDPPASYLQSKIYCANNGTWNSQVQASDQYIGAGGSTVNYSTVVVGNDTYLLYMEQTARLWKMHNYTTLTWGSEQGYGASGSGFDLCYDYQNGRIYVLGMAYLDDSALNISYYELSNGTFISQEFIEEYWTLNSQYWGCTHTTDQYGRMGLLFVRTIYPPFELRFAWLSYPIVTPPTPPEPRIPAPDLVSMYIHLALMLLGLLMMFFAVTWGAWGIRKKGLTEVTIERGGYCMLIFLVGFSMLFTQLY